MKKIFYFIQAIICTIRLWLISKTDNDPLYRISLKTAWDVEKGIWLEKPSLGDIE